MRGERERLRESDYMNYPFPESVSIHFTTKAGGVSQPPFASNNLGLHVDDNAMHVLQNRQSLQEQLAVDAIQWLKQVHGNTAVRIRHTEQDETPAADASFTQEKGLACAILTADCLPVLFASVDGSQVAAAHAGWRGLAEDVLLNTLSIFKAPSKVIVCFGAAIGPAAFEVGAEVKESFPWATDKCFKKGQGDKYYANLYQLAFEQLHHAGVAEIYQAVFDEESGANQLKRYQDVSQAEFPCTYAQEKLFYSYRRDKQTGRMASLIWLT